MTLIDKDEAVRKATEHVRLLRLSFWSDGYPRIYELPNLIESLIVRAEAAEAALARAYMAGRDDAEARAHERWVLRSEHAANFFEMHYPEAKIDSARAEEARAIAVKIRAMPVPADLANRLGVGHE